MADVLVKGKDNPVAETAPAGVQELAKQIAELTARVVALEEPAG